MSGAIETHRVDPSWLGLGTWDEAAKRFEGEGVISASYSADRIGMGRPLRAPFRFQGGLWVCVGNKGSRGSLGARAYRLVPRAAFNGKTFAYGERVAAADAAREDPSGFYHGIVVRSRGAEMVLCGPPACFVPGEEREPNLFAAARNTKRSR